MNKLLIILSTALIFASVSFGQGQERIILDAKIKKQTIDSACVLLVKNYIFPDQGQKMANLLKKNLKAGIYANFSDPEEFVNRLTSDIRSINNDRHLAVRFGPRFVEQLRSDTIQGERLPEVVREHQRNNFGFYKVERLAGNIGYIDLRMFDSPRMPGAGAAAVAALNFLSNTQAIIFDLRKNGGGDPEMIQLISTYLFDEETHLNDLYNRPTDFRQQYWIMPWVPGPRMPKVPVYILTSNFTFSGAEEFSNNLRELKRATIVGQKTGGGAHPVDFLPLNDYFVLKVSIGRAINPITGKNWEGIGVIPHIEVPADSALAAAYLMALDTLIKAANNPDEIQELTQVYSIKQAEYRSIALPDTILLKYPGIYGIRNILFRQGNLYFQREKGPMWRLFPISEKSFIIDEVGGQVNFINDEFGKVIGFDLVRSSGDTVNCKKQ